MVFAVALYDGTVKEVYTLCLYIPCPAGRKVVPDGCGGGRGGVCGASEWLLRWLEAAVAGAFMGDILAFRCLELLCGGGLEADRRAKFPVTF